LFHCEGRLRNKFAIFADPRPMGHVHLNPVGPVVKLLARCLARLDRTVNELRSFWHVKLRSIAFQRITAGGRNGASRNEYARPWYVAGLDPLLDLDISASLAL